MPHQIVYAQDALSNLTTSYKTNPLSVTSQQVDDALAEICGVDNRDARILLLQELQPLIDSLSLDEYERALHAKGYRKSS